MERMTAAGRLGPPLAFLPGIPTVCALLERSNTRAGLIGLEYIVELVGGSRKDPATTFHCVLCNQSMPTKGATLHHVMQNVHKVEFLRKHFPKSLELVMPFMTRYTNSWQFDRQVPQARFALRHICTSVEERFGRQTPYMVRMEHFVRAKLQYERKIEDGPHFIEDVPVPLDKFNLPVASSHFRDDGDTQFERDRHADEHTADYDEESEMMPLDRHMDDGYGHNGNSNWTEEYDDEFADDAPFVEAEPHVEKPMINVTLTTSRNSNSFSAPTVTVKSVTPTPKQKTVAPPGDASSSTAAAAATSSDKSPPAISHELYSAYKRQLDKVSVELQAQLLKYETEPENHPLYPDEWKAFWAHRSAELLDEGTDVSTYDFSADWTRFWLVRVHELNDDELDRADRTIRRELNLPVEGPIEEPPKPAPAAATAAAAKTDNAASTSAKAAPSERAHSRERRLRVEKSSAKVAAHSTQSPDRRRSDRSADRSSSSAKERSRPERDRSPLQRDSSSGKTDRSRRKDDSSYRSKTSDSSRSSRSATSAAPKKRATRFSSPLGVEVISDEETVPNAVDLDGDLEQHVTEPVTVISVLRLLSAFEDLLGSSLGPRVVDLLSKAVALEKVKANLADDLLMSAENSVLLDTVKEKLKGILLAGVVEGFKVKAVRKVIAHVNSITRIIDKQTKLKEEQNMAEARVNMARMQEQERIEEELRKQRESEKKRREETESRALVTKQLATSITLQGKMITKEQLEALTDVYIHNHSTEDTPYLFGLQMGSRFPDLKGDSGHGEVASQESQATAGSIPDQHPMHWNAHHQPPVAAQMQQQHQSVGHYGVAYGLEQQQQQQQQQHHHQLPYNSYEYYNNASSNTQHPQHTQQSLSQQQQQAGNPFRNKTGKADRADRAEARADRPNLSTIQTASGNHHSHGAQQMSTTYERSVTVAQEYPKSQKSSGDRSRTQGSYSAHSSSRSNR